MIEVLGHIIKPTIFPDNTSQVWKLPDELVKKVEYNVYSSVFPGIMVYWNFESEAELMHVCQLSMLLRSLTEEYNSIVLHVPYLPYGRQDKEISNESTFSLHTFKKIVSNFFESVITIDAHSDVFKEKVGNCTFVDSFPMELYEVIESNDYTALCFPDKGAKDRYYDILSEYNLPCIVLDKVREPLTGEITGLKIVEGEEFVEGADILIGDDICCGGRTFIETSKILLSKGAKEVDLYISHGLFTKGTDIVYESGIGNIFTKDGLVERSKKTGWDKIF